MQLAHEFRRIHEQDAIRLRASAAAALTPAVRAMLLRKAEESERLARGDARRETPVEAERS